jgi:hypothetical protein
MVVLASLLAAAFFSMVSLDQTATGSYTQSLKAEQLGLGSLHLLIGQLQQEMGKDAPPDTGGGAYPNSPVYTNVSSVNILPQAAGTNAAMPVLLKTSSTTNFYTGTLGTGLASSSISSTAASLNGRSVSLNRWDQAYMGTFPNNASAPNWLIVTRGGPVSTGVLGANTANSLNNPTYGNTNFAIGRVAYAIYDEGSLLDINVAGYPTNGSSAALTSSQLQSIKGALAGADVSTMGIDPNALTAWRNAASAKTATSYLSYVTNFASTNGFQQVYPGDTTFLGRQDLINAAQNGTAGLSTSVLTNLATFTREINQPSWGPTYDATDLGGNNGTASVYAYKTKALTASTSNPNRFIPDIRSVANANYQAYHDNGAAYSDPINAGDPVVRRRFSLARLAWLGPNGPQNGGTAANIQACFGLKWQSAQDSADITGSVWAYVGPTGSTEVSTIETLDKVAAEGREPNFFEMLQAGMLAGSLGVNGDPTNKVPQFPSVHQAFPALQILRVGANIICQTGQYSSGGTFYPVVIEYNQSGLPWLATGVENLPMVNMATVIQGVAPPLGSSIASEPNGTVITLTDYITFGLFNPNHTDTSGLTPPPVRLHLKGSVGVADGYATPAVTPVGMNTHGISESYNGTIQLSTTAGHGVYGFATPGGVTSLTTADVAAGSAPASSAPGPVTGGRWETTYPLGILKTTGMVGYRITDLPYQPIGTPGNQATSVEFSFGNNKLDPFNAYMEFQSPSGGWVPYQYLNGINNSATWINGALAFMAYFDSTNASAAPVTYTLAFVPGLADMAGEAPGKPVYNFAIPTVFAQPTWDNSVVFISNDPRSVRFSTWEFARSAYGLNVAPDYDFSCYVGQKDALWVPATAANRTAPYAGCVAGETPSGDNTYLGFGGKANTMQAPPYLFAPGGSGTFHYFPAQLARNNFGDTSALSSTQNATSSGAAASSLTSYVDNDGLRRVGDSGSYTDLTASDGNPFYNIPDKPIILHRPFQAVGELGYVFRDDPWRTLDFFSGKSPDAGLLDLFSLSETVSAAKVVAGRIDLNSQNAPALKAVLSSTLADVLGGVTMSNPANVATALQGFTAATPLINKSELVTKFISSTTSLPAGVQAQIKAQREAAVRALADVGQTRTWNLMIDLIAQVGRYPAGASDLSQFVVEGERRYWLHIAIDRITGKIVDQQLETVSE